MKNKLKIALQLIGGGLGGFLLMYLILDGNFSIDLSGYVYPASLILVAVSAVLMLFSVYLYSAIRKSAAKERHGEEEDLAEGKMYRQYSDATLANTVSMILSLTVISLMIIAAQPVWLLSLAVIVMLVTLGFSLVLPTLLPNMYPDRDFPSVGDKDFSDKLLKMSDDGERHVMLGGLYKTYLSMNSLMISAIVVLMFYSVLTGTSQMMGIFTIAVILIIANTKYSSSIRNR